MGNSIGCSASGERLVSAAREGDFVEAKMLLDSNPCLAKYSTFGGLNSPLHFAAAKGHNEIVALLLENGADVNSRNYSGQTPLMQACRYGHWEVVQTLLLYRCNVTKADYLNGRTALHFATVNGHVRCIRLVLADFVPSAPFESWKAQKIHNKNNGSNNKTNDLFKFVNKSADGGVTALHMAALNGYSDCVQLLLDLRANISATTFNYGTTMDLIGAGSTPLHYAACGGNLKCSQILVARGASRLALNCNGWLPLDVTRIWGRHWLESLLAPNSVVPVPTFPPSNYLSLPLLSLLNIARDAGSKISDTPSDEADTCAVCLERACGVAAEGCEHELCVRCALYLCSSSNIPSEPSMPPGSIPCPLCRHGITYFIKTSEKDVKLTLSDVLCIPDTENNSLDSVSSERFCPVSSCSPLSSVASPQCACSEAHRSSFDSRESQPQESSEREITNMVRLEKTTCSNRLWGSRRSREHQCNAEIDA